MKKRLLIVVCLMLVGGCSTTYEPHLVLPATELTRSIDATVEVHPFVASDELVSGHSPYGVRAEDYRNKPPSELTQALTREVITELSARRVFRKVSTYDAAPDLILTGRIERFFEHNRRKAWTLIPGVTDKAANLFGANPYTSDGEVHLTMTLHKPTGDVVGLYVGHAQFNEDFTPNSEWRPGDRLNRGLAEAVAQIRDQMLADPILPKTRILPPVVPGQTSR
ncbi:MAG: hypothetical protein K0S45_3267 [Nitrospira sp.]|nr:hypothetical protein [Nitrospira sp.]